MKVIVFDVPKCITGNFSCLFKREKLSRFHITRKLFPKVWYCHRETFRLNFRWYPNGKNYNVFFFCPRDQRFSASWVPNWGPPWNPLNIRVLWYWGLQVGPLISPPLCRETQASRTAAVIFFQSGPLLILQRLEMYKICHIVKTPLRYLNACFMHNIGGVSDRSWHDSLSMYYNTIKLASYR